MDIFARNTQVPRQNLPWSQLPVARTLEQVGNRDDFIMTGPKFTILTGSLDFNLSPGRTLYTGKNPLSIHYASATSSGNISLAPYSGYRFTETTKISQRE